jgi:hypothetical protein
MKIDLMARKAAKLAKKTTLSLTSKKTLRLSVFA